VRPGREHDTTALRAHAEILPALRGSGSRPADPRRPRLRGRDRHHHGRVQEAKERRSHPRAGPAQQGAQRGPRHRGTWELPAQDHVQSTPQCQPEPLAHRSDRRRCPSHPPRRERPNHVTTLSDQILARKGSVHSILPFHARLLRPNQVCIQIHRVQVAPTLRPGSFFIADTTRPHPGLTGWHCRCAQESRRCCRTVPGRRPTTQRPSQSTRSTGYAFANDSCMVYLAQFPRHRPKLRSPRRLALAFAHGVGRPL
jgi:hypothetical protein